MARLLIIDDDELTRLGITRALEQAGVACDAVADVPQALSQLRRGAFDGVLLDVEMSPIDGVTCLTAIRAERGLKDLPVIMMSGLAQRELVMRVAKLGVRGLVLKNGSLIKEIVRRVQELSHAEPTLPPNASENSPASSEPSGHPAKADLGAPAEVFKGQIDAVGSGASPQSSKQASPKLGPVPTACSSAAEALEALKSLKPVIGRQELLDRVLSGNELRAMGPAARQVLALAGSESASVDSVARAIKQDQAMSLRILKLANSPLYRRGAPLDSVAKAVARIGTTQIRQTVLAMSVMDQFQGVGIAGRLRADAFWEHSIITGLLAAGLAKACGGAGEHVDSMFTAGLLHDVGRMLFVERLGDLYAGVLDLATKLRLPLEAVESRLLLLNHADLTDRLLREWTFPADMVVPIAYHHLSIGNIRSIAPRALSDAATLALANRLAHCAGSGSSGNDVLYPIEEFVSALGLKPSMVASVCDEALGQFEDLRATMLIHSSGQGCTEIPPRRADLAHVRACCISGEPASNPVEYALRRMGVLAGVDTPNVLVLRVSTPSERPSLLERARAVRAERQLGPVPTLVLGNVQGCFFEPNVFDGAPVEQHLLPLQNQRFEASLVTLAKANLGNPSCKAA